MPIIVVCSNLADVVDTDSGWCKEVEEQIQVVEHERCSMALATPDMLVDHTRGSLKVVEVPEDAVGRDLYPVQEQEASGKKGVAVVGNCTWDGVGDEVEDGAEHNHQRATAHEVVGSRIEEGERQIVANETVVCAVLLKDRYCYSHQLSFYCPGN